nr:poly-gamma-glutamate synthase PgsB [Kibdelosporangium sp. MJ126-NF4]
MFVAFASCCLVLLVLGIFEQRRHYANLRRIPTRVLINGIRGKSSITRLCAGALRGGGLVTVAKTTGTAARFIHPDGSEEPVYRKFGIANVVEQIGIVRRASAYRPDVLTIECMAVMPDLQEINQSKLIQSTIGVLCNVREDHLAEMGPTLDDVARSLSRSMPVGGICVTAEQDRLHILKEEAARRDCELIAVDPEEVTDEQMAGFSWITFKENVAIALAVADLLGVNRQSAFAGMWSAPPDPGVLSVERYEVGDLQLRFANIFAANDPESTLMNIEQLLDKKAIERPLHVVINCRPDRVERNGQMGELIPRIAPERVVLIGEPTRSARVAIPSDWQGEVVDLGGKRDAASLLEGVLKGLTGSVSLVTVGNIHGQGEVLLEELSTLKHVPAEKLAEKPAPAKETKAEAEPVAASRPRRTAASAQLATEIRRPVGTLTPFAAEARQAAGALPATEIRQPVGALSTGDPRQGAGSRPAAEVRRPVQVPSAGESRQGTGSHPATEVRRPVRVPSAGESRQAAGAQPATEIRQPVGTPSTGDPRQGAGSRPAAEVRRPVQVPSAGQSRQGTGSHPATEIRHPVATPSAAPPRPAPARRPARRLPVAGPAPVPGPLPVPEPQYANGARPSTGPERAVDPRAVAAQQAAQPRPATGHQSAVGARTVPGNSTVAFRPSPAPRRSTPTDETRPLPRLPPRDDRDPRGRS